MPEYGGIMPPWQCASTGARLEGMSPTQFRTALKRLKMPLTELARRVRVHVRTVRRWASGEVAVPESVALLLACWIREPR